MLVGGSIRSRGSTDSCDIDIGVDIDFVDGNSCFWDEMIFDYCNVVSKYIYR